MSSNNRLLLFTLFVFINGEKFMNAWSESNLITGDTLLLLVLLFVNDDDDSSC